MVDLNALLNKYRMIYHHDDTVYNGMRVNRLFGLHTLIQEHVTPEFVICEIGSYAGISSSLFAYYCKTLYCVDPFIEGTENEFDKILLDFKNVIKVKEYSVKASESFVDRMFDLVYIDALHEYEPVLQDISHWIKKVKVGGIISGHDYDEYTGNGVCRAVDHYFGKPDKVYEDSSWLVQL